MANNEIQGIQIFSNKQMFIIKVSWIHFYLRYSHVSQGGNNYINKHSSKIDLSNTIEDIILEKVFEQFPSYMNCSYGATSRSPQLTPLLELRLSSELIISLSVIDSIFLIDPRDMGVPN